MSKKHHTPSTAKVAPSAAAHRKSRTRTNRNRTAIWISLVLVVVAIVVVSALLLKSSAGTPTEITVAQAHDKYQASALFVDVRTQAEWNQGHIAKSVLMPLDELPSRLDELPHDRDIVVVCRSGARSKEGTAILRDAGFTRVSCMTGGLQAWTLAGYPLEQ